MVCGLLAARRVAHAARCAEAREERGIAQGSGLLPAFVAAIAKADEHGNQLCRLVPPHCAAAGRRPRACPMRASAPPRTAEGGLAPFSLMPPCAPRTARKLGGRA